MDSLLVADVPTLEAEPFASAAQTAGLDLVLIASTNTAGQTLTRIARLGSGYTYCVTRAGVTGETRDLALDHQRLFDELRQLGAPPPILGFGISTPDQVRHAVASSAAGVIVGSAIVRLVADGSTPKAIGGFINSMKAATYHSTNVR